MNILVLNCGSSTLKFQIIEISKDNFESQTEVVKVKGIIERIGSHSLINITTQSGKIFKDTLPFKNHTTATEYVLKFIISPDCDIESITDLSHIHAVGHRVVHGGEKFVKSVLISNDVLAGIEECIDLAPLHNPSNLKGIHATLSVLGKHVPQAAVFDTAFHATIPEVNYLYPIPYQFYRRYKIRKYGFHGTSHRYVAYKYALMSGKEKNDVNIITIHLGNGCSACAIKNGKSFNTTMGFTPVSGLMMGTRSGDIDHSMIDYLAHKEGLSTSEIDSILNKSSGLIGISGLTNDMRDLLDEKINHDDRRAKLAINMFCMRVKHFIGAYIAEMNGADALVFTGGIGENSASIRQQICENFTSMGISLDEEKNSSAKNGALAKISDDDSKVAVWVIPTNEELLIARDTYRCVENIDF